MGWWADLRSEMIALKAAPWSATTILVAGLAIGAGAITFMKTQEIADLKGRIDLRDDEIDRLNSKAASDNAEIEDLKNRVGTIEEKLSAAQVETLKSLWSDINGNAKVFTWLDSDQVDKDFAAQIVETMKTSGWTADDDVSIFNRPSSAWTISVVPNDQQSAESVTKALAAANVPFEVQPVIPTSPETFGEIWVKAPL
jgi:hypothetical protein